MLFLMPMPFVQMPMQLVVPVAVTVPRMDSNSVASGMIIIIQRPTSSYGLSLEFGQILVESTRHRKNDWCGVNFMKR